MSDDLAPQPTAGYAARYDANAGPGGQLLGATQIGQMGVRLLDAGSTTELESHEAIDSFCFVRKGTLRVLGADNSVIAELGLSDSVVLPAGTAYRLEAGPGEATEVIHCYAAHAPISADFRPFD